MTRCGPGKWSREKKAAIRRVAAFFSVQKGSFCDTMYLVKVCPLLLEKQGPSRQEWLTYNKRGTLPRRKEVKMITFDQIRHNETINTYIRKADASLVQLGYTEHSFAHVSIVARNARYVLETLGYDARTQELVQIAAYLHDIGNLVNRVDHSQSGAVMAFRILDKLGMDAAEIAEIVTAIGNHDEGTGRPVSAMAAALILADKCDVRRSRVRNQDESKFDIHDRVNYSVQRAELTISEDKKSLLLKLSVDPHYGTVMDYFEIFMGRMQMCRNAAEKLGLQFRLEINDQELM